MTRNSMVSLYVLPWLSTGRSYFCKTMSPIFHIWRLTPMLRLLCSTYWTDIHRFRFNFYSCGIPLIVKMFNKPVRSLRIVFSAHAILSWISHLLFNQEQKKVKTKEGEKFGIKSHAHWRQFLNYELAYRGKLCLFSIRRHNAQGNGMWFKIKESLGIRKINLQKLMVWKYYTLI